jgi:CDP-diacylglycerol--serine O-phosphatidyltransferase
MKKRRIKKVNISSLTRISFLPSVFTMLNLFLGFQALLYIIGSKKNFKTAIYYITASVIMDGFDGTIARLTKTESNFGVQLDSLVDAVTFGLVSFVFLSAGLIRLARYNVFKEAQAFPANIFIGVPIPTASLAICSIVLILNEAHPQTKIGIILFSLYIILISLLMISNIKYKTIKKIVLKNSLRTLFLIAMIIASLVIFPDITIPILTFAYMLSPLFFSIFSRKHKNIEPANLATKQAEEPGVSKTEA